jgi:hypothetical protein
MLGKRYWTRENIQQRAEGRKPFCNEFELIIQWVTFLKSVEQIETTFLNQMCQLIKFHALYGLLVSY